jgi:hypothetical protein
MLDPGVNALGAVVRGAPTGTIGAPALAPPRAG